VKASVLSTLNKNMQGNEVLVLACYDKDNESFLIVGGNTINLKVYSLKTGILVTEMEGHTDSVTCMVVDANILITGSDDCSIRLWNLLNFTPSGVVGSH
jgi:WD40 repeat protein